MSNRTNSRALFTKRASSTAILCGAIVPLMASHSFGTIYTYTTPATTGTASDNWSSGANWTPSSPMSGSATELTFVGTTAGLADTTNNDVATPFVLNDIDLTGAAAATTGSLNITGGALDFVSNAGTGPVANLTATGATNTFTVANNVILGADTTFSGAGTSTFNFNGVYSGPGALIKSGSSAMVIGSVASTVNTGFAYGGNINVSAGTLNFGTASLVSSFYGTGNLSVTSGGTIGQAASNLSFATINLSGTGALTTNGALTAKLLVVNSTGATSDLTSASSLPVDETYADAGVGNFLIGTIPGKFSVLQNSGTGLLSAVTLANVQGANVNLFGPAGTTRLSGDGATTGPGIPALIGGTLLYQPVVANNTPAAIVDTIAVGVSGTTVGYNTRIEGNNSIRLDANGNTSVEVLSGSNIAQTGVVFNRNSTSGTLVLTPTAGAAALGTTDKFVSLYANGFENAIVPQTNNMFAPWVVVANNDVNQSADFVSYSGSATGAQTDTGFQAVSTAAPTNLMSSFAASTATSIVELNANSATAASTTLAGATAAYSLRADNETITLGANNLTLGGGLILNGSTIGTSGDTGILALGTNEAVVYASGANATINTNITTSSTRALTKFGPGTLFLTGTTFGSFTGTTSSVTIGSGALDVGTLAGATTTAGSGILPGSTVFLNGGVLQANGSFSRPLGTTGFSIANGTSSGVSFNTSLGTLAGESGGFSARGNGTSAAADALAVNIGGAASPASLVWSQGNFVTDLSTLEFGSTTANGVVTLQNPLALGAASPYYYRQINVTAGTGGDSAVLGGVVSDTVAGAHGLMKEGNGTLMVAAANTYTGLTAVTAGTFGILAGGSLGNTGITVNSGATFAPAAGTFAGSGSASLTALAGSTINLADGTVGNFNLNGSGTSLALGSGGIGTNISFDLMSGGADDLVDTGVASLSGTTTINIATSGSLTPGMTYDLLQASAGLDGGSGFQFAGGGTTETVSSGGSSYVLTLSNSPSVEFITVSGGSSVPEPAIASLLTVIGGGIMLRRRRESRDGAPSSQIC